MQGLAEFFKTLGVPRLIAMGVVTAGLIAFFAFIMVRVTSPTMTMLFSDLSQEDFRGDRQGPGTPGTLLRNQE